MSGKWRASISISSITKVCHISLHAEHFSLRRVVLRRRKLFLVDKSSCITLGLLLFIVVLLFIVCNIFIFLDNLRIRHYQYQQRCMYCRKYCKKFQFCGSKSGIQCFLTPESGIRIRNGKKSGSEIRDTHSEPYFYESLLKIFQLPILKMFVADPVLGSGPFCALYPGSGMEKSGSGITPRIRNNAEF